MLIHSLMYPQDLDISDCDDSNETLTALMDAVMKDEDIPSNVLSDISRGDRHYLF